ncbi:hypothetical protein [Halobacteriovorax sp. JY17]|uniref:type II secretion system protein n=1 Tax=Halobacteriovorax sp. JY17 TaxID=2014617 RepID=UPI000C35EA50|nr:hypothetical protein [Halobacteriovorax sp. JY17]PIK15690.1 MAG: hypothetical protein CES88_02890 [Halobacteriovorax sp. JY17]
MLQIKNNRGFSQINLMVGVFFLAIAVFIVVHTIEKQTDSLRNITAEAEVETYLNSVKKYLSSPINCNETLRGVSPNNQPIQAIKTLQKNQLIKKFEVGSVFGASETKVIGYQTSSYNNFNEDIEELGMMNLVITLRKNLKNQSATDFKRSIKLYMKKEKELISECAFGGLPAGEEIAEETPNGIRLNSFFIGVNTQRVIANINILDSLTLEGSKASCTLDILGSIQFNTTKGQFEQCKKSLLWEKVHR